MPNKTLRKVFIFDTTLRDGEQSPGASLDTDEKIEIARQLQRLNVDVIEAGFPVSSQGDFDSVRRIAEEVHGPSIAALARALEPDIERAWEAIKVNEKPIIHTFIGTSKSHVEMLEKNYDEVLAMAVHAVEFAKSLCLDVEFSAMDATRSDATYLFEVIHAAVEAGAMIINIPDTAGHAMPDEFRRLIKNIYINIPEVREKMVRISVHCHDDLGQASANSLKVIKVGATQIECTINGIGERAGNCSLEQVVMSIKTRREYFNAFTDVMTTEIIPTSRLVSRLTGIMVPPNKPIVGANAFAHSSGIHQDGVLKDRSTFEVMNPEDVGLSESEIVLSARSGRHALRHRLEALGFSNIGKDDLDNIYAKFMELADKKKYIYDDDLRMLMSGQSAMSPSGYQLVYIQVIGGTLTPVAVVKIKKGDEIFQGEACGDGPFDAVCKAIDKITGLVLELRSFSLNAATKGKDAIGNAFVSVSRNGDEPVTGKGDSTDIIEAAAKAYLAAVNIVIQKSGNEDVGCKTTELPDERVTAVRDVIRTENMVG